MKTRYDAFRQDRITVQRVYGALLICWFSLGGLLVLFCHEELDMMPLGKLGLLFNAL